jgi:SAM-dependent methyltransferase
MNYCCIFCNNPDIKVSSKRRPVGYLTLQEFFFCKECGGFSLWPALSALEISQMYSINYISDVNANGIDEVSSGLSRFWDFRELLIDLSSKYPDLSILDYGCGADAQVLLMSHDLGISSTGVELEESTRAKARSITPSPIFSPDEILISNQEFDVIFLGDLLEHVYDPIELLSNLKKLLSERGVFFIQGPLEGAKTVSNFLLSIKARVNNGAPSNFPPYHVSLASLKSIQRLLVGCGLEAIALTIREPQWPAKSFGSKESLSTFSNFVFSISKLCDILINKFLKDYGTRFYCVVKVK